MASRAKPTQQKRARERARLEKRQQKEQRRQTAKADRPVTVDYSGQDPDIAGIRPGPQPNPWGDEEPV